MGITGTFEGYISSPLYIFNNGTWSNVQTTGWTGDGTDISGGRLLSISWGSSSSLGSYATEHFCTRQTINLTNYKYIKVNATAYGNGYTTEPTVITLSQSYNLSKYLVFSNTGNPNTTNYVAGVVGPAGGVTILDVSNINGNYYIYIGMRYYDFGSSKSYATKITQLYLTNS